MEFIQNKDIHTLCIQLLKNNNIIEFKENIINIDVSNNNDELLLLSLFEKKQAFIEEILHLKNNSGSKTLFYFDYEELTNKILENDDVELIQLIQKYINTENYDYIQLNYLLYNSAKKNCLNVYEYLIQSIKNINLDDYMLYDIFFNLLKFKKMKESFSLYDTYIIYNINLNKNDILWCHKKDFIEIINDYNIDEIKCIFNKLEDLEFSTFYYIDLYLDLYKVKNINEDKFIFILDYVKDDISDDDITKLIYEACVYDNFKLFKIIQNHYKLTEDNIMVNLKNNRYFSFDRRNYKQRFILEFGEEISLYFFNLLKEDLLKEDIDCFIQTCIDKNKIKILKELKLSELKINKNKIKTHLLEIVDTKHIDIETLKYIFQEVSFFQDNKFIIDYFIEYLTYHREDKIYFLYEYIKNIFDKKEITKIFKKIKLKLSHHIGKLMYESSDDYDWIFIDNLNKKIEELNVFELIKKNSGSDFNDLYELSFVYWIQKNNYIDIIDDTIFHDKIQEYHHRYNKLSPYIIQNLEYDEIMKLNIQLKLENEENKISFLKELYEFNIKCIIKVENINKDINNLFSCIYQDNKILSELFLLSIKQMDKEKTNHILRYIKKKFNIRPIKILVKNIVDNDNFYLLKRIYDELNNKKNKNDLNKYMMGLIKESINENNQNILHWACIHFENEELKQNIFENFLVSNNIDLHSIMFYMKMYQYLNIENKFKNTKNIIYLLKNHYNKKKIIDEIIDKYIDYDDYDKIQYLYKIFIDYFDIYYLKKLTIKFQNNIELLKSNINIEYHLIYSFNIEKIHYLYKNGFNVLNKDNFKNMLSDLLEDKMFLKKISYSKEINFIDYLKVFELYDKNILDNIIDSNLLIKILKKLKKLNLEFSNIHNFINKYDIVIDLDFLISINYCGSIELFKYFYEKSENINLSDNNEELFLDLCINGNYDLAKYLLEIKPDIDLQIDNDSIFSACCNNGQFKMVKWLYSIIPDITYQSKYEHSICGACYYGHLKVAKWLMKTIENLNIKVDNDYCMIHAVENEHLDMVYWINELESERYNIIYNDDNTEIIEFTINKKLIIEKSKELKKDDIIECPICYENKSIIITCCNHQFCFNCLDTYNNKISILNCAYCRKEKIELFHIIEKL
jgi:hypothetical protein